MPFFSKREIENPWAEDPADRRHAARATVSRARSKADALCHDLPRLSDNLKEFGRDLTGIEAILMTDPDAYRQVRPLVAVHLPAIITSLETLAQLSSSEGDTGRLKAIETDICACLVASRDARRTLEAKITTDLEIETQVLLEALTPVRLAEPALQVNTIGKRLTAWTERGTRALSDPIAAGLTAGQKAIGSFGDEVATRFDASIGLARGYVSDLVEDGIDHIAAPVTRRISAIGSALSSASSAALAGGLVTAIIFPPAIPIAMGLSLIDGRDEYGRALETFEEEHRIDREKRLQDRATRRSAMIARVKGTSPVVRLETPHVHLSLNPETGECHGMILTGRHAGETLATINIDRLTLLASTAPDEETREILLAYRNRTSARTDTPSHRPKPDDKLDALGLSALGLEALALEALG